MWCAAEVGPGDVESRYTKEYEEQLNPFTDFQDKERSARRRQLSPTDRLLYEVGQMVSGSRYVVHAPPRKGNRDRQTFHKALLQYVFQGTAQPSRS